MQEADGGRGHDGNGAERDGGAPVTVTEALAPDELIRLDIPALPAFVGVARVVTTSVATTVDGIADERLEDLRIAVSEACTNAVEAHDDSDDDRRIVLRCTFDGEVFEVHIEDHGAQAGEGLADAEPSADGDVDEQGWGLQLIRALVDDVSFTPPGPGTHGTVRLAVRSSGTS